MERDIQLNVRLSEAERAQLERVCRHYEKSDAAVVRYLIWQATLAIEAGDAKPVNAYARACERLKVTREDLQLLMDRTPLLSDPPTVEEIENWLSDETLRTPREMVARLSRA